MPRSRSAFRNELEETLFRSTRRFLTWLGPEDADRFGRGLGRVYRLLDGRRRRLTEENLTRAFPEASRSTVVSMSRAVFSHFGGLATDLVRSASEPAEVLLSRVEVVGAENARKALATRRGLFLVTPHLGSWELAALVTGRDIGPTLVVARPLDNPLLEEYLRAFRERTGNSVVPRSEAAREMLRKLRAGGAVGLLPDQHARSPDGILVPFFGRLARTTSSLARLCLKTGALLVPALCVRTGPARWRMEYFAPQDVRALPPEEQTAEAVTLRVNAILEWMVRRHPEQWLWLHNRWRT